MKNLTRLTENTDTRFIARASGGELVTGEVDLRTDEEKQARNELRLEINESLWKDVRENTEISENESERIALYEEVYRELEAQGYDPHRVVSGSIIINNPRVEEETETESVSAWDMMFRNPLQGMFEHFQSAQESVEEEPAANFSVSTDAVPGIKRVTITEENPTLFEALQAADQRLFDNRYVLVEGLKAQYAEGDHVFNPEALQVGNVIEFAGTLDEGNEDLDRPANANLDRPANEDLDA